MKDLDKAYSEFFEKSEAGKYFITQITELIDNYHEKAEADATFARDYTQTAKGVREVKNHIRNVLNTVKKGTMQRTR